MFIAAVQNKPINSLYTVYITTRSLDMAKAADKDTRAIVPDKKSSMALKQNISGRTKSQHSPRRDTRHN